jgi:hypothetical protein
MNRALLSAVCLTLVPALAQAQANYSFAIDSGLTNFTWSGTTSLGDINENPANFTLVGTTGMTLTTGGNPIGSAAFLGGDALVSPNISGSIPNPLPFLPPLATLDLTNAHVALQSGFFSVDPSGNFTASVTLNILAGTMTINDLTGGTSVSDLAGLQSTPAITSGSVVWNGSSYHLAIPVSGVFPFDDPASGTTGSLTLNGTLHADHVPTAPASYCPGAPNSVGSGASCSATGSTSIGMADLVLHSAGLPQGQFGVYFYGPNQVSVPFGNGTRCVGGTLVRLAPINSGSLGSVSQPIDNSQLPALGQLSVGATRNFQFWYRDPAGGGSAFNLSSALSVTFAP